MIRSFSSDMSSSLWYIDKGDGCQNSYHLLSGGRNHFFIRTNMTIAPVALVSGYGRLLLCGNGRVL